LDDSLGLVEVRPNGDGDERQQYGVDDSDHRDDETRDVVVGEAHVDGYITVKDDEPSNAATDGQRYDDRPDEECGKAVDEVDEHPDVVGPMENRGASYMLSAQAGKARRLENTLSHRTAALFRFVPPMSMSA